MGLYTMILIHVIFVHMLHMCVPAIKSTTSGLAGRIGLKVGKNARLG